MRKLRHHKKCIPGLFFMNVKIKCQTERTMEYDSSNEKLLDMIEEISAAVNLPPVV